jgi:membrane protease YdiL (CAAX protease family)
MAAKVDGPPPSPAMLPLAAGFYAAMLGGALLWLWLRERTPLFAAQAVGPQGLLFGVAVGAGVGALASGASQLLARYLRAFAQLESWLAELAGPLAEREIMVLALLSGVVEEVFFRLAMQDALGVYWAAAVFALLHAGRWLWTVLAGMLGLLFGWMMEAGFGLVSVSIAHAIINYIGLRRMRNA